MIMTVDVRPEFRDALPAITHVNGSARVQTVAARDNPEFHALLRAVAPLDGQAIVLEPHEPVAWAKAAVCDLAIELPERLRHREWGG